MEKGLLEMENSRTDHVETSFGHVLPFYCTVVESKIE